MIPALASRKYWNVRLCDLKLDAAPKVTLHGKGKKVRVVPLMKDTMQHLYRYMSVFHAGESMASAQYLFYTERKGQRKPICDDTVRLMMQKYADLARPKCQEIPAHVHPHLWRHTRAMHLCQHGMDLTLVSQWLGHTNVETTLIYAHADTEHKRQAITRALDDPTALIWFIIYDHYYTEFCSCCEVSAGVRVLYEFNYYTEYLRQESLQYRLFLRKLGIIYFSV